MSLVGKYIIRVALVTLISYNDLNKNQGLVDGRRAITIRLQIGIALLQKNIFLPNIFNDVVYKLL